VEASSTFPSNLHVKIFDMKVRKKALSTLTFLPNLDVIYQKEDLKADGDQKD